MEAFSVYKANPSLSLKAVQNVLLATATANNNKQNIGNVILLEKIGKFYYSGDMLDADGGWDLAIIKMVKSA